MQLELDEYAHLDSPIHRWQPKAKLVGLMTLVFAFAFVKDLHLLPAMLAITALLYALSRLPLSFLLKRLRYPGFFLLGIIVLLPFSSGSTVIWQWGWLTLRQEGVLAMVLVVGRFLAIVTTGFILLGTTPFLSLVKAMRSLGLPTLLADMTLLTYRYLFEIGQDLATMRQAMRLRGFTARPNSSKLPFLPDTQTLRQLASLVGTLLVRSYEQSERVYKAMRLRGYGQRQLPFPEPSSSDRWSLAALGLTWLTAAGFVIAEYL
jgi:cobalt/nickel transport system permease protein